MHPNSKTRAKFFCEKAGRHEYYRLSSEHDTYGRGFELLFLRAGASAISATRAMQVIWDYDCKIIEGVHHSIDQDSAEAAKNPENFHCTSERHREMDDVLDRMSFKDVGPVKVRPFWGGGGGFLRGIDSRGELIQQGIRTRGCRL